MSLNHQALHMLLFASQRLCLSDNSIGNIAQVRNSKSRFSLLSEVWERMKPKVIENPAGSVSLYCKYWILD